MYDWLTTSISIQTWMRRIAYWASKRSLGTVSTQVRDDPSSRLTELEEDEEIIADTKTNIYNSHSLSQPVPIQVQAGRKKLSMFCTVQNIPDACPDSLTCFFLLKLWTQRLFISFLLYRFPNISEGKNKLDISLLWGDVQY